MHQRHAMNTNVVDAKKDAKAGNVNVIQPTLSVQNFANVEESALINKLLLIESLKYNLGFVLNP